MEKLKVGKKVELKDMEREREDGSEKINEMSFPSRIPKPID